VRDTIKKVLMGIAAVAALALGGAAIAGAASSGDGAATEQGTATTAQQDQAGQKSGDRQRTDETPLTGPTASRVEEAALAETGGGTVERVETDADGHAAYEAHVVKSDGTRVTVYVDEQFAVVGVEECEPGARPGDRGDESQNGTDQNGTDQSNQT
jgi:uncharacterized membrane protein YkoI